MKIFRIIFTTTISVLLMSSLSLGLECGPDTEVCLSLEITDEGVNINFETDVEIAGYEFLHNGCITEASGGFTEETFDQPGEISISETAFLVFSLTGSTIDDDEDGILVQLNEGVTLDCLSEWQFSDPDGTAIEKGLDGSSCSTDGRTIVYDDDCGNCDSDVNNDCITDCAGVTDGSDMSCDTYTADTYLVGTYEVLLDIEAGNASCSGTTDYTCDECETVYELSVDENGLGVATHTTLDGAVNTYNWGTTGDIYHTKTCDGATTLIEEGSCGECNDGGCSLDTCSDPTYTNWAACTSIYVKNESNSSGIGVLKDVACDCIDDEQPSGCDDPPEHGVYVNDTCGDIWTSHTEAECAEAGGVWTNSTSNNEDCDDYFYYDEEEEYAVVQETWYGGVYTVAEGHFCTNNVNDDSCSNDAYATEPDCTDPPDDADGNPGTPGDWYSGIKCYDIDINPYTGSGYYSGDQSGTDDPEPDVDEISILDVTNGEIDDDDETCYKMVLIVTGDTELSNDEESPYRYGLSAIYPNPFNPSTTIEWSMMQAADYQIDVYNINGQLVDVVSSGFINSGPHSITWTPNNLSTGAYFIKLTIDNEIIESQKVMLLK